MNSGLQHAITSNGMDIVDVPKLAEPAEAQGNINMQVIVDAVETAISKPLIKNYVFVTEDCSFVPLMVKLRQLGCFTTAIVMSNSIADKLKTSVDEVVLLNTMLQVSYVSINCMSWCHICVCVCVCVCVRVCVCMASRVMACLSCPGERAAIH